MLSENNGQGERRWVDGETTLLGAMTEIKETFYITNTTHDGKNVDQKAHFKLTLCIGWTKFRRIEY